MIGMQEEKFIVIRDAIAKKNPKLLKWMPGFLLRYIERIVHEEDINKVMQNIGHLDGLDFVDALIGQELKVDVELKGAENIPLTAGVVFASNHPLGGLDGVAFMHALGKYRKDIKFLVNDILMNIKNLHPLFIPINKHGSQAREAMRAIDETYASEQAMLVFPAGLVSRKSQSGLIKDLEWKKSFITKAKKYKKDIIPVYIEGRNSDFFYNLARFRKNIGIGANIEMFFLADEMFAQRGKKVTIVIGRPISYTLFDNTKTEQEWAEVIKETVYAMA
jgi:putative hemolysin